ncbi:beta-N-acetylhexosaminidase [Streptantibioticus cattleyicolor NRRL 8057 = DSM 46488]|uniref:beta-N-acetylhexosaminidase n=1 Tax=Streptantibioticus cattleyicolor (strain ATCC 35852 / DSM 46488 / JCM 4925 / NBRC 14057 / NRRL 8057) TaxID=1003195 RepID=G8WXN6_STREN|nr:beta-N-acetylhexosaminidase [Streptantibioticus cattleyicolor NRRL 8057 = DSM 46488]
MRRRSAWRQIRGSGQNRYAAAATSRLSRLLCAVAVVAAAGTGTAVQAAAPATAATVAATPLGQVVPVPASVRPHGAPFTLTPATRIDVAARSRAARPVADYLAGLLRPATGYRLPVTAARTGGAIVLRLDGDRALGDEGYRLTSGPGGVEIRAARPAGLFHGVQTLRQLLPAGVERHVRQHGPWTVAGGTITDVPRYSYRGAMLDVARHFFTVPQVERYIDELALYKVNRLHLHLTDDQGWRIAVSAYPRLASYGGSTEVGGGPGGYYTKAQYQQIVRYAASRFLTVVPEVDMPAHTNAALASYADLNCNGVAPPLYTGTKVGFSSLCVPKDVTYRFVAQVLREIAALTPGPYLHIGGDEAHSTKPADYVSFMDRIQPIVGKLGKTVIGWHQLTDAHPVRGAIAQYWGTAGNEAKVVAAAKAGTKLVMSPANHAYLDMKYNPSSPLGLNWAGYVEVKDAYGWDPATFLRGAPASAVLGVEAPLWSETISTEDHINYLAFPRLPAIAELGWSPAATHNWESFRVRLAAQGPRWDALGIDYYRSPQVGWPAANR